MDYPLLGRYIPQEDTCPFPIEVQFFKRQDIKKAMFTNGWCPITMAPFVVHITTGYWNGQHVARGSAEYEEKQRGQE
jgi:hypothetical protein